MTGRLAARAAVAMLLVIAMTTTAAAQANVQQKIRYGTIVSADSTIIEVQAGNSGAQAGATVGAVAGYAIADGRDRWLGSLLGGALGGAAGRASDKGASKKKGWQLIIKLEETGEEIGVQVVGKKQVHHAGDRVRLFVGPGGKTEVKKT